MNSVFQRKLDDCEFPFVLAEQVGEGSYVYHWHEELEILLSLEKSFNIGIETETFTVNKGEIVIVGAGESHCLFASTPDARRLVIRVNPSLIFSHSVFAEHKDCFSQIKPHSIDWPVKVQEQISHNLNVMWLEWFERKIGWQEIIYSEFARIAAIVLRELPKVDRRKHNKSDYYALKLVLNYLSEKYNQEISLKSCADELGFNESYLSSMFKKRTGTSFHQYLVDIRLNSAEWMLLSSDAIIAELADKAGFSSIKTFHRVFYEKHGISPGVFRKQKSLLSVK
jgi:AraC-like DNA-binding protein